ncbi:hypothetical protein SY88_09270 [Clostridiales bacterium PH28_bin88]|nr:hypothetical protein SY88_09270 [Clostridiales bacterium PH28_bin88]
MITLLFYYALPKGRLATLAIANMLFYGIASPPFLLLFLGMSIVTYLAGLAVNHRHGRAFIGLGIALNALNLLTFKYATFLYQNLVALVGLNLPQVEGVLARIVLPIGISFYTFQLIAYLVDVQRGKVPPCRSLLAFWVFIGLFPQVVAGPIMRAGDLLPQVFETPTRRFSFERFRLGIYLILWGFFKKMVLADSIAPMVDRMYADPSLTGAGAWLATYLFAFQIYYDFSAYSDLAVGIGSLMGFSLNQNFFTPYISKNPGEFWQRWHVTLSSWIRDYVYIPLGGSRKGRMAQYRNMIAAMAFSGLWHGAAWTFVAWGIYHGVLGALNRATASLFHQFTHPVFNLARRFIYFHLVVIGWVFFRSANFSQALYLLKEMLKFPRIGDIGMTFAVVPLVYLLHVLEYFARKDGARSVTAWRRIPSLMRGVCYVTVVLILVFFMRGEQNSFIYFRF